MTVYCDDPKSSQSGSNIIYIEVVTIHHTDLFQKAYCDDLQTGSHNTPLRPMRRDTPWFSLYIYIYIYVYICQNKKKYSNCQIVNMQHTFHHLTDLIHSIHYTVMTVIVNKNITLQGVIATQKHQLRQQPVAHSCPV